MNFKPLFSKLIAKEIRDRNCKLEETDDLKAKMGMIASLILTTIIGIYGIELGIRVSIGEGRLEYLVVVLIVLILLSIADILFYRQFHSIKTDL